MTKDDEIVIDNAVRILHGHFCARAACRSTTAHSKAVHEARLWNEIHDMVDSDPDFPDLNDLHKTPC